MNEYLKIAVNLLRNIYQDDFTAIAQIITAEADGNKEIIIDYLTCVEEFVVKLKEKVSNE